MSMYVGWHGDTFAVLAADKRWTGAMGKNGQRTTAMHRLPTDEIESYTTSDLGGKLVPIGNAWITGCGNGLTARAVEPELRALRDPTTRDVQEAVYQALERELPGIGPESGCWWMLAGWEPQQPHHRKELFGDHGFYAASVDTGAGLSRQAEPEPSIAGSYSEFWSTVAGTPDEVMEEIQRQYLDMDATRPDWPETLRRIARMIALGAEASDRVSPDVDAGLVFRDGDRTRLVRVDATCESLLAASDEEIRAMAYAPAELVDAGAEKNPPRAYGVNVAGTWNGTGTDYSTSWSVANLAGGETISIEYFRAGASVGTDSGLGTGSSPRAKTIAGGASTDEVSAALTLIDSSGGAVTTVKTLPKAQFI